MQLLEINNIMGFFNSEKGKTAELKEELKDKTDEELEKIAKAPARTSFFGFSSGRGKQLQVAAFELLRERRKKSVKTCPFCTETIPQEAKVCKFCGREI